MKTSGFSISEGVFNNVCHNQLLVNRPMFGSIMVGQSVICSSDYSNVVVPTTDLTPEGGICGVLVYIYCKNQPYRLVPLKAQSILPCTQRRGVTQVLLTKYKLNHFEYLLLNIYYKRLSILI